MNLLDRASKIADGIVVIREWIGSGGEVVDIAIAQRRADICKKCPENQNASVTEVVALAIKKHLEVKNALALRVQGEKSLATCNICGCALRLKIWLPVEKVRQDLALNGRDCFPPHCWQLKETEQP